MVCDGEGEDVAEMLERGPTEGNVFQSVGKARELCTDPEVAIWLKAKDVEASKLKFEALLKEVQQVIALGNASESWTFINVQIGLNILLAATDLEQQAEHFHALSQVKHLFPSSLCGFFTDFYNSYIENWTRHSTPLKRCS